MCPETEIMCVRRYILVWQVEVLASCLVEALIIAAAKPNHQGQQSSHVWEALSTAATTKCCCCCCRGDNRGGKQESEEGEEQNVEVTR